MRVPAVLRVASAPHLPGVNKSGRHGLSRAAAITPAPRDALPLGDQAGQGAHRRAARLDGGDLDDVSRVPALLAEVEVAQHALDVVLAHPVADTAARRGVLTWRVGGAAWAVRLAIGLRGLGLRLARVSVGVGLGRAQRRAPVAWRHSIWRHSMWRSGPNPFRARYGVPGDRSLSTSSCSSVSNVATSPGAAGVPRWSVERCAKSRFQPLTRPTNCSSAGKSAFQQSEP